MDDLIAFLTARLDEDEAVAREAASALPGDEGYGWRAVHRYLETHPASGESFIVDTSSELVARPASARSYDRAVADHIARHDPARVLREVAAKRAIVEAYRQSRDILMDNRQTWDLVRAAVGAQRVIVTQLAAVWSDHADYRREWAL